MIRPNTLKMADGCGEEATALKNQNWGYYEAKCLVEIWADEEIRRQLSAMNRKQNICRHTRGDYSLRLFPATSPLKSLHEGSGRRDLSHEQFT